MKKKLLFLLSAVFTAASASSFGLGIRMVDQDAAATARGEAFTATADNPSAIYYNPAGITQLERFSLRTGFYGVDYKIHYSPIDGGDDFETRHADAILPTFFATYSPKDSPVSFGLGAYSPFGLTLEWPDDAPFRTVAKFGTLRFFTVNPVVAVEVARGLSFAAGLTINTAKTELTQGFVTGPLAGGDEFTFKGTGTALGFNAGVLWQPTEQHSFGVRYTSGVDINFSGHTSAKLSDRQRAAAREGNAQIRAGRERLEAGRRAIQAAPLPPAVKAALLEQANAQYAAALVAAGVPESGSFPESFPEEDANGEIHFPQVIAFGYSFRPTPQWNFEVNVDWTDWDRLNTVTIHQQQSADILMPFNWESSFIYSFGATRHFVHGLRASLGYAYSEHSVPEESFNPIVPDSNRHVFSAGFGQKTERLSWDLAYQFTHGPARTINRDAAVDGRYRFRSHALTLSLGYHF